MTAGLLVTKAGFSTVTDLGRDQGPTVGMPVGGALDQYSARVANILVANAEADPLVEVTALGFAAVAETDVIVSITGAPAAVTVDERPQNMWEPFVLPAGTKLSLSTVKEGLRSYIAVHSAFPVPRLLGSVAPDTAAGFGTKLAAGTRLPVVAGLPATGHARLRDIPLFELGVLMPHFPNEVVVSVTDGPDKDQFNLTFDRLFAAPYVVSPNSNHVGLRMAGLAPVRESTAELISRGVPIGAVEVPPGDELLVLHRGRGVTAGYPVLAVVTPLGLDALGQTRPGQSVRFIPTTVEQAISDVRAWRSRLDALRHRIDSIYRCIGLDEMCARPATAVPS